MAHSNQIAAIETEKAWPKVWLFHTFGEYTTPQLTSTATDVRISRSGTRAELINRLVRFYLRRLFDESAAPWDSVVDNDPAGSPLLSSTYHEENETRWPLTKRASIGSIVNSPVENPQGAGSPLTEHPTLGSSTTLATTIIHPTSSHPTPPITSAPGLSHVRPGWTTSTPFPTRAIFNLRREQLSTPLVSTGPVDRNSISTTQHPLTSVAAGMPMGQAIPGTSEDNSSGLVVKKEGEHIAPISAPPVSSQATGMLPGTHTYGGSLPRDLGLHWSTATVTHPAPTPDAFPYARPPYPYLSYPPYAPYPYPYSHPPTGYPSYPPPACNSYTTPTTNVSNPYNVSTFSYPPPATVPTALSL